MKQLQDLKWQPRSNEHVGCVKGCLDYLGVAPSYMYKEKPLDV